MLVNIIHQFFTSLPHHSRYVLAFSGGLDSSVLLHLCSAVIPTLDREIHIRVVHINHTLSPNAAQWVAHCQSVCANVHIPFASFSIDAHAPPGESPEAFARAKRYEILSQYLQADEVLLTAHHQEDQAETLLLQLMRGSGVKGLAAMPQCKAFGQGVHARPLLACARDDLKSYAERHQLRWVEDESNSDTKFSRNFIRHSVLPLLQTRWPGVVQALARTADHCAEGQEILTECASEDLVNIVDGSKLSVSGLLKLSPARQRLALRTWIQQSGFLVPEATKLNAILKNMLTARSDRSPHIHWEHVELRRFRDFLYVMPRLAPHNQHLAYEWDLSEPLAIPGIGNLQKKSVQGQGFAAQLTKLKVRFRQGGELCALRKQHKELKKLFQEWNIPPWLRDRIPLLYSGEQLIGIIGLYIHEDYSARAGEEGYLIQLT